LKESLAVEVLDELISQLCSARRTSCPRLLSMQASGPSDFTSRLRSWRLIDAASRLASQPYPRTVLMLGATLILYQTALLPDCGPLEGQDEDRANQVIAAAAPCCGRAAHAVADQVNAYERIVADADSYPLRGMML